MSNLSFLITLFMVTVVSAQKVASVKTTTYQQVRTALLNRTEIALVDVREEALFAQSHPLFAANIPLSQLELEVYKRIPRRSTSIVVYDAGEGLAVKAVKKLVELGYQEVSALEGGLSGWKTAGGELFKDVNVPSKSFGELVESQRHTPMLSAEEVKSLIDKKEDIVIVDARRFDEYQTMNIPGSISVPGAELVLRIRELAPDPATKVIVNCAGRTRSIIGTQSLINAGIPNKVVALRNGTIGWTLAGQQLEHGQSRHFGDFSSEHYQVALKDSRTVADKAGVKRATSSQLTNWLKEPNRTTYRFDVRTPEEFICGHLPGFKSAPGGQLVQETDHFASVRGARIVLADDQSVRANMSASWLAQMGWEVYILDDTLPENWSEKGSELPELPSFPIVTKSHFVNPATLSEWLEKEPDKVTVIDLDASRNYVRAHIPGAWFAVRSQFEQAIKKLPVTGKYVLTSSDGKLAQFAYPEFQSLTTGSVYLLEGGTKAWTKSGKIIEGKESVQFASPDIDRYKRPYEGTNNPVEAMEDYLEWEYGLVDQLAKDGTHGFFVIQ